jgi:SulP family sulfate permease
MNLPHTDWATFGIGLFTIIVICVVKRLLPKWPAMLVGMLAATAVAQILKLDIATIGSKFGELPRTLPKPGLEILPVSRFSEVLMPAFTIALLAGIESLLSCVVSVNMIGDKHNSNTELIALGTGNILVGFFGGIPATGAIARTAANVKNGGRSPLSGITHALVLLLVLALLMPLASYIPMPIISAILFVVAYNMSEWRKFVAIIKSKKWNDILVLVTTFALTVIFDLVKAIAVGLVIHYAIVLVKFIIAKRKSKKNTENKSEEIKTEDVAQ